MFAGRYYKPTLNAQVMIRIVHGEAVVVGDCQLASDFLEGTVFCPPA